MLTLQKLVMETETSKQTNKQQVVIS